MGPAVVETPINISKTQSKVDVLFVVDNSPSMMPKQAELRKEFPLVVDKLDQFAQAGSPGWYHFGVITSDLGAGPMPIGNNACVPGGQGGKLQTKPQSFAVPVGISCTPPGNDVVTGMPAGYIDYDQKSGGKNVSSVKDAFTCMASVGDQGCGYEHQLEATYQALKQENPETAQANTGFLRDDAVLVVVFLTDEDDCSAPQTTNLFDPTDTEWGVANSSFRCTQYGLTTDGRSPLPGTAGTFSPIASLPNPNDSPTGRLFDVDRYINLFTKPKTQGGIKDDPNDVILVAILGPVSSDSISVKITMPCENNRQVASCPVLEHSCVDPTDTNFFADPAVRIHSVVQAVNNRGHLVERSICQPPYSDALDAMTGAISTVLSRGCLANPVVRIDGKPQCTVQDVAENDGVDVAVDVPACANDGTFPCWKLADDPHCSVVFDAQTDTDERVSLQVCREATCDPMLATSLIPAGVVPKATCKLLVSQ
jgi:hypothetical protein